ncbi:MAG: hypothetical protein K2I56_07225 [Muribaculaceae bacterium]|nr:hypothetical protein [Muribaculaceae bacterium]
MIRRSGNFGFIDNGSGALMSFNMNARGAALGWTPASFMAVGGCALNRYVNVLGVPVIPYGRDNDLPGYVERLMSKFYAGEGIMGKKTGLQWGEGPQLYTLEQDPSTGRLSRQWGVGAEIMAALEAFGFRRQMLRCLVDLVHLEGFWVKVVRNRAPRVGRPGRIARLEHVPASRVRFVYAGEDVPPTEAVVADFPNPVSGTMRRYPLFDPADPLRHPVSLAYYSIYSYNKDHYSTPRFEGAFEWIELAGTLAPILMAYNENASAISMHIESPQSYWDKAEARLRDIYEKRGEPYSAAVLERFKDEAMEVFAASVTGRENAGKFMHTSQFWNSEANSFEGWKVTPIDKKIKDYIDAQVAISKKSEAAATSGFGLDPALSNLILDTKLGSGSEKLYSLKVYNATETAIPDMVLCDPVQTFIDVNYPGSGVRVGLYRNIVEAEQNVNPENRVKSNI